MRKYLHTALAALALLCLAGGWQSAKSQEKAEGAKTLKVKLNYSGTGTVDEKHKIFLFVFDTPDFMQGANAMPIGVQTATVKDATVTFSGLAKSPVYLIAAYDPTGAYEGMSPPPSGSSLGLYSTTPGQVDPIKVEAGKPAEINLPFDDSMKMP